METHWSKATGLVHGQDVLKNPSSAAISGFNLRVHAGTYTDLNSYPYMERGAMYRGFMCADE